MGVAYLTGIRATIQGIDSSFVILVRRNCPNKSRTVLFGYNSVNRESAEA